MSAWLAVIGIGEDGMEGLSAATRALVRGAELLIGGARHLALVPQGPGERLVWAQPIAATLAAIRERRGRAVVVLASGDPMCYGAGAMLARHFAVEELLVVPAPSAFSLAAARLLWPIADCAMLSLHGRPLDGLRLHLAPGARLLVLTSDGTAPAAIAALLASTGWGRSELTVLEHLGGSRERRVAATAETWGGEIVADLNLVALECRPSPGARAYSRRAGLPDDAFANDGQLTKREVRAVTLAALAPLPGECLWDIGAGAGSVAIEWLRCHRSARAVAIERNPERARLIAENAIRLGVPELEIVEGEAPTALAGLAPPDAIFLGGGVEDGKLWDAAWAALKPGGRVVANAVTIEGAAALERRAGELGGGLTRLTVERAEPLGRHRGFRALRAVTQLALEKPR